MWGNVIYIFSTMNMKLIRKACSIFSLKIPLEMSLTVRKLGMNDCGIGQIYRVSFSKLKIRILCR